MKTKVVISVSVNGCQPRPSMKNGILCCLKPMIPCLFQDTTNKNKIMTIAVTLPGVEKVSIEEEKNLLTVIGEGIDTVELVNLLRKKVGFAAIVNQGPEPVEKAKQEKPPDNNNNNNRVIPIVEILEIRDPYYNYSCFPFW